MGVTVKAGQAYITATPSSQDSQVLRARASSDYTAYTINANSSGATKYDWIYLSVSATNANAPASDASNVTSIYTSRSSSNTTDNGTPPTYGLLLAIVTVTNAASSITNSNITDKRFNTSIGAQNGSLIVTQASTGTDAIIQAAGIDASVNLNLETKGTGAVKGVVDHLYNPYKFSVYRNGVWTAATNTFGLVTFDTKIFDTGSNYSTSTGKFTVPIAGFYYFSSGVRSTFSNGSEGIVSLYKNGSEILRGMDTKIIYTASNTYLNGFVVSGLLELAAGDYIQVYHYGNAGAGDVGQVLTYFHGFLVSAT